MAPAHSQDSRPKTIRKLRIAIVSAAVALGLVAVFYTNREPRTEDAVVLANFIGIAPKVEGLIERLNVRDNQFVKKGELLFEIDDRPYRYALERTQSEQASLEGQIEDEQRRIEAKKSAVLVAESSRDGAEADRLNWQAAVEGARADVANAQQGVNRAKAEWEYAAHNLRRLEPLLGKQFVTVDQVDQARTLEEARSQALKQAGSQWEASKSRFQSPVAQFHPANAQVEQSKAQVGQAGHAGGRAEGPDTPGGGRRVGGHNGAYHLGQWWGGVPVCRLGSS